MEPYYSHQTAAILLGVPGIESIIGRTINAFSDIHITVPTRSLRRNLKGYDIHYSDGSKLPPGSLQRIGENLVASPQLVFVQMGQILTFEQHVMLGYQLCSHIEGPYSPKYSTKEMLSSYIQRAENFHGCKQAREALKHVAEGSCSYVESVLHMKSTLPHVHGGLNIPGIQLNQKVTLTPAEAQRRNEKNVFIDLCNPEQKVGLEYMSNAFHPEETFLYDYYKASILANRGYRIVEVRAHEVYNRSKLEQIMLDYARLLKHRVRINTDRYQAGSDAIYKLLERPAITLGPTQNTGTATAQAPIWDQELYKQHLIRVTGNRGT